MNDYTMSLLLFLFIVVGANVTTCVHNKRSRIELVRPCDETWQVGICHSGIDLCVSSAAAKAHLAHGDWAGFCGEQTDE